MKKLNLLLVLALASILTTFGQKKTNGTIYIEHPAITVVENMTKAFVSGDSDKVASYLADDFKSYNGVGLNPNDKGQDKASFSKSAKGWFDALDYYSISRSKGAYPDAIEYKDNNQKDVVWVQTWEDLKGVHKKTGVKVNMPMHRLFIVNKDNKIQTIINYNNTSIGDEIAASYSNRTNGTIYNHHENINTIRKVMSAFENLDVDKSLSYYSDDATFNDINDEFGKSYTKEETKPMWQGFLNDFEITSIDVVGYPDYLEYEMSNGREVLSWWKYNVIRKSDKKKIALMVHLSNGFDAEGKIISQTIYYSDSLLNAK
tara:strand:+ start:2495 stop:3442 length:948 start_codon:yes stop_codon:yes gene_type:complete